MMLTEELKIEIKELFYRTKLYENEEIIDNSDLFISKKVGLSISIVANYLQRHLKKRADLLNSKINLQNKI